MYPSNDLPHSNLQSPNSLFHIDRQLVICCSSGSIPKKAPENWMDGYSDQFYDITIEINADLLTVHRTAGPSR